MDHFGIGIAVKAALEMYFACARGTGRTTSLLESVKDGDRVIFAHTDHAKSFDRLCKERGVKVEIRVSDPANPAALFNDGTVPGDGRLMFDHVWVEKFYRRVFSIASNEIDRLQKGISGHGAAHRETDRAARERAKFQNYL